MKNNFESGKKLDTEEAQKFSRKHPRCGTSFIFIIMLVTIFSYAILDTIALLFINKLTIFIRFFIHLIFLPLVAGVGYEVLKFLAFRQHIKIFHIFSKPGIWLQNITTQPPNIEQIEVALYALKDAFGDKFYLEVNDLIRGIFIDSPGNHKIKIWFSPMDLKWGDAISWITFLVIFIMIFFQQIRQICKNLYVSIKK